MNHPLRYYQQEALDAVDAAEARGVRRQLIVLPTAAGKTTLFARVMQQRSPALVLAHREELLHQAVAEIEAANPDLSVAIEQGPNYAGHSDVVVASVATLGRAGSARLLAYPRDYFRMVVVDEAHHAAATTYRRVLDHFSPALHLGVTATPRRGDNLGLSDVFDEIVYAKGLEELINEGFLAPLVGYRFNSSVDLSDVKIVRGEYAEGDLAAAVNIDARNQAVVEAYQTLAAGRKVLVFCVNVAHAQAQARHFRDAGIDARPIWGAMPSDDRAATLAAHEAGEFPVLTNVAIATEGYNSPSIDTIIMARPTQSTLFFTQAIGRGTRLFPGKDHCLVIDIADVTQGRRPVGLPSLVGLPNHLDLEGTSVTEAAQKFRKLADSNPTLALEIESLAEIDGAWEKINLFTPPPINEALLAYSQLIWMELGDEHYVLNLGGGEQVIIRTDALDEWFVLTKAGPERPETQLLQAADMVSAFRFADAWVKENRPERAPWLSATARWRTDPPTEKQVKWLKRNGIPWEHLSKGEASQVLDKLFADKPKKKRPQWLENRIAEQRKNDTYKF